MRSSESAMRVWAEVVEPLRIFPVGVVETRSPDKCDHDLSCSAPTHADAVKAEWMLLINQIPLNLLVLSWTRTSGAIEPGV